MDFKLSEDNSTLQKYVGESEDVIVPEGILKIQELAFKGNHVIQKVNLPRTLDKLEDQSFKDCENLKEVFFSSLPKECSGCAFCKCKNIAHTIVQNNRLIKVPQSTKGFYIIADGIEEITEGAFCECAAITEIIFPKSLKRISSQAFKDCKSIEKMVIPNDIELTSFDAFDGCEKLLELQIPDNLIVDEVYLPANSYLQSIKHPLFNKSCFFALPKSFNGQYVIPEGITTIADLAFSQCVNLERVFLPKSLKEIGEGAFLGCVSLRKLEGVENVTHIKNGAFYDCPNLTIFRINSNAKFEGNPFRGNYNSNNPIINNCLVCAPEDIAQTYYVPSSVNKILPYAFEDCDKVETIIVQESVTEIGEGAFAGCHNLKSIILLNSINILSDEIFYGCKNLIEVSLPDSIKSIGHGAFNGCSSLNFIAIPLETKTIGSYAFRECTNLTEVFFYKNSVISEIGEHAFDKCRSLISIAIPEGPLKINDSTFKDCYSLESIEIPNSVKTIADNAFEGCKNIRTAKMNARWKNMRRKLGLPEECSYPTGLQNYYNELGNDEDGPMLYTYGRMTPCPYCNDRRISTYADGTAQCLGCRKWFRYA